MGYLNHRLEKLAAEAERSFGDNALLAGGALAGAGGAGLAGELALGSDAEVRKLLRNAETSRAQRVAEDTLDAGKRWLHQMLSKLPKQAQPEKLMSSLAPEVDEANFLRRLWRDTPDNLSRAYRYQKLLAKELASNATDAYKQIRKAPFELNNVRGALRGAGHGMGDIWRRLPKKVKLLAALGLPVTGLAGYGGYKATEAAIDD